MGREDLKDPLSVTYVIACLATQLVIESMDDLKNHKSPYYKANVKVKANELQHVFTREIYSDLHTLFKVSEKTSQDMIRGIEEIAKLLAKADGDAVMLIKKLLEKGFNFSEYKLVKIEE